MITELLIKGAAAFLTMIVDALPTFDPPRWLLAPADPIVLVFAEASSMSVWINLPLALIVGSIVFASLLIGAATKLSRIVLSLFTGGGGGAA